MGPGLLPSPKGRSRASQVSALGPLHGQLVRTPPAHMTPRGILVSPPTTASARSTSVSLTGAHVTFFWATARGGAHTVASLGPLQGPGTEEVWRRASSFHPPKTRTHPHKHTHVRVPAHRHTRVGQATGVSRVPPAGPPAPWPRLLSALRPPSQAHRGVLLSSCGDLTRLPMGPQGSERQNRLRERSRFDAVSTSIQLLFACTRLLGNNHRLPRPASGGGQW